MDRPPLLQPGPGQRAARASQLRSPPSLASPTRPHRSDDLLSRITPRTVVDALRSPSGQLKKCLDTASASEKAFAMRIAVASNTIHEWLEELAAWPWPTRTSAGFERPPAKRRKLFQKSASDNGLEGQEGGEIPPTTYLGSLEACDVEKYELRIHEISRDIEELNVEEIKSHILHNHIMPLSRPGTPLSESIRLSTMSASSYAYMDDFTALLTATIVQALPNLSKLTRLLNTWSVRLLVLRKSASFLTALMDADVAVKAGWKAMESRSRSTSLGDNGASSDKKAEHGTLSQGEFGIMKAVVEKKVAKAGQYLDFMLDTLEGTEETLPEDWIDSMDAVEQDFADWAAACERHIREAAWAKKTRTIRGSRSSPHLDVMRGNRSAKATPQDSSSSVLNSGDAGGPEVIPSTENSRFAERASNGVALPPVHPDGLLATQNEAEHPPTSTTEGTGVAPVLFGYDASEDSRNGPSPERMHPVTTSGHTPHDSERPAEILSTGREQGHDAKDGVIGLDRPDDIGSSADLVLPRVSSDSARPQASSIKTAPGHISASEQTTSLDHGNPVKENLRTNLVHDFEVTENDEGELAIDFLDTELPEPELPALPRERRDSEASIASTVVHGVQSGFSGMSSDPPDQGTPEYRRFRDVLMPSSEAYDPKVLADIDPPSSPPDFRSSTRSLSVSFNDIPTVVETPEEDSNGTPPDTPLEASFGIEDDPSGHVAGNDSPSKANTVGADNQLQQQISEILDSIPAKIRLTSDPSTINLNPPDFNMPTARAKAKPDSLPPRSYSSLSTHSSRAGTPSFTLAPARNFRPRHQRSNQEIKLYHLSRSNGEAPIKLFIRCVGDNGERVMVRVGGGWADLGEYLKEYASHHGRRGGDAKVEVRDLLPRVSTTSASPASRPASALDGSLMMSSPVTPLNVRKARRSIGSSAGDDAKAARQPHPKTPLATAASAENSNNTPSSSGSSRSRSSSRLSWTEEDMSLGMAGPKSRHVEMSEEKMAWVKSMEEKVRLASGDQRAAALQALAKSQSPASLSARAATPEQRHVPKVPLLADGGDGFGELGKVGSTKRLFRKPAAAGQAAGAGAVGK